MRRFCRAVWSKQWRERVRRGATGVQGSRPLTAPHPIAHSLNVSMAAVAKIDVQSQNQVAWQGQDQHRKGHIFQIGPGSVSKAMKYGEVAVTPGYPTASMVDNRIRDKHTFFVIKLQPHAQIYIFAIAEEALIESASREE